MEILSVNVGLPREVMYKEKMIETGIFKEPVNGPVMVRSLNIDGDAQADLTVHGGRDKAVYAYPIEHYDKWRRELPEIDFSLGIFGENLTISGLKEEEVQIGDCFRFGDVELKVTEPRMPCYKLGIRFGRTDIINRFLENHRSGFYLSVLQEGEICAGDKIVQISKENHNITVTDIFRLYTHDLSDPDLLRRAAELEALPASWRDSFKQRIK